MKKLLSFLLMIAMLASMSIVSIAETGPETKRHQYGDINFDGKINDLDVISLKRFISKWNVSVDEPAGDIDQSGDLADKDCILLMRTISKWNITTKIGQEVEGYKYDLNLDVSVEDNVSLALNQGKEITYEYALSGKTQFIGEPVISVSYRSSDPEAVDFTGKTMTPKKMGNPTVTVEVRAYFPDLDYTVKGYGNISVEITDTDSPKITLTNQGKTDYTIVGGNNSTAAYIDTFQETLKEKTGAEFKDATDAETAKEIVVITPETNGLRGITDDVSDYRDGGYHLFVKGQKLVVSAKDAQGVDKALRYLAKYYVNENSEFAVPENLSVSDRKGSAVKSLKINGNDISEYVIVKPAVCAETMNYAASELSRYIRRATGIELPIVTEKPENSDKIINLILDTTAEYPLDENGNVIVSETNFVTPSKEGKLEKCGFTISVDGNTMTIEGAARGGNLNGVYEFLENYLGWKFLDGKITEIYPRNEINIPDGLQQTDIPAFEYRAVSSYNFGHDSYIPDYTAPRKVNGVEVDPNLQSAKYGAGLGRSKYNAHSFYDFINEYYYQNDTSRGTGTQSQGKDISLETQPCLTNEENYQEFMRKLYAFIDDRMNNYLPGEPGLQQISVGWNDNPYYCHNSACRKVLKEENGSEAGSYVRFANRVQEELNQKYPELEVFLLAYWNARQPTVTKLNDNTVVCYCWGAMNHAITDMDFEDKSRDENLEYYLGWIENSPKVYEWYYNTNFTWYMAPLPILSYIGEDMKFFAQTGCKGIYAEARDDDNSYAFEKLVEYMISQTMWDPYMTEAEYNALIDEYMQYYFGDGWSYLREYIQMWETAGRLAGEWPEAKEPHEIFDLDYYAQNYEKMCELFDKAEAMANSSEQQYRIQTARCHMEFLGLSGLYRNYETFTQSQKEAYAEKYFTLYNFLLDNDINLLNKNDTGAGKGWMADYKDKVASPLAWVNIFEE